MQHDRSKLGLVVIGRNEGERLARCLESAAAGGSKIVYVDSGSTDGSRELAQSTGVEVVELDLSEPFTAARARNAGFSRLRELVPEIELVQFVDGDCEIVAGWLERAIEELSKHERLAVVCGLRSERRRAASIYNRLCDMEWQAPLGDVEACGGDAMMRVEAFAEVGGFDAALIAGEEPELCVRLRARGWKVRRLDVLMTRHDAALERFGQWWTRTVRSGHAAAEGLALHGRDANRTNARIVQSAGAWSALAACWLAFAAVAIVFRPARISLAVYSATTAALLFVQWLRIARGRVRRGNVLSDALLYATFCLIGKPAELRGAWTFVSHRRKGARARLIEYKGASSRAVRVAYLVNQYPKTSHSFIRREIAALEAEGFAIERYSIRRVNEALVDERDRAEALRTHVLLDAGVLRVGLAALVFAAFHPLRASRALALAASLGWRSPKGVVYHLVYWIEACVLVGRLARSGITHLHAHFATNPATVATLVRAAGGPRYSFTFHGPEIFDAPNYRALAEKIARAHFVVAISDHGKSQLWRWSAPSCWPKIALVRCGLDASFLEAPTTDVPERKHLVCVARLSPEKGHLVLLDAVKRLADDDVEIEIDCLGDGAFRPTLEARIAELGLARHVRLLGWKDSTGVREAMQDARAIVLPSFDEGLPVVFMESFALERPVIATYIAGIPELVEDGVSGWLVPAGNIEKLVDALREAVTRTPSELRAMGAHGRARVSLAHSAAIEARRLGRLLRGTSAAPAVVRELHRSLRRSA